MAIRVILKFILLIASVALNVQKREEVPTEKDRRIAMAVHRDVDNQHGRRANTPSEIGQAGWRQILWRVYNETSNDNIWVIAAGVAFYSLLSLFPAIAATIAIYGIVADPSTIENHLTALSDVLPADARDIVIGQVHAVASSSETALSFGALITLGFALWTSAGAMKALMTGLTIAYDETDDRSFIRYNITALALTLGAILVLLVSLGAIIVLPIVMSFLGIESILLRLIRWPILALMVVFSLAVLYRYAPARSVPKWRWVTWGSVIATVLWVIASIGFAYYVSNFGSYNETYGTLGAVVILLMWFWISAYIVLGGAELNAEMEHQTSRDTTESPEQPIGRRGAYVADHVADT